MSSPDDKTVIVPAPKGQEASRAEGGTQADAASGATVIQDASARTRPGAGETQSPDAAQADADAGADARTEGANASNAQDAPSTSPTEDATQVLRPGAFADTADASANSSRSSASASAPASPASGAEPAAHQALPIHTRIAEFEIVGLIGEGGFGIVYLAWDTLLRRHVALKEYIPAALAARVAGSADVTVRSQRHADTFRAGLKSFINEAQLLAQFDHHSLVKVYRFWEANGTAYMVMPYYEGVTLKETLRQLDSPPSEAWLRALLAPLIDALAVLHAAQCFHRDIAPDNIMLLKGSQRPLLLDFGAARRVISDMTQALTVILKPGYAPLEQYAEVPSMKQGPWTDIYALAAVVYYAIEGKTPPASVGRLMGDTYAPLASGAAGRYSDAFLRAVDHALAVRPEDRPQDVHALAAELGIALDADGATGRAGAGLDFTQPYALREGETALPLPGSETAKGVGTPASAATGAAASRKPSGTTPSGAASATPPAARKRGPTFAALGAGVAVVAALGAWFALRPTGSPPVSPQHASAPAAGAPAQATQTTATQTAEQATTSPAASAAAGLPPVPQPGATAAQTPSTAAGTTGSASQSATAAALAPYTPSSEFDRIVTLADPSIEVHTTQRTTARIKKDFLQFQVTSSRAGRVYAFMVDPQGNYLMLLPNQRDKANSIAAGQTLTLPRPSWPMLADAPAGPIRFLVIVSPEPRDFSLAGLHPGDVFADFPAAAQRAAAAQRTAAYSPFAGTARCAKPGAGQSGGCSDAFGAATFEIDVVGGSAG